MTRELSNTIEALRTTLCILIVFLHMRITATTQQDLNIQQFPVYNYIVSFTTLLSRIAVPLFFTMSGYLYFYTYIPRFTCYLEKSKRRVRHLIQPIAIWTTLYLVFYYIAQQNPYTSPLFSGNNTPIADYNWKDLLDAYTGIFSGIPFAGQYWFLRNLFLLSILSPLFWFIFKYTKWIGLLIVGIIWVFQPLLEINAFFINSLFFFWLGGYMGYAKINLQIPPKGQVAIYASFFILLPVALFLSFQGSPFYMYFYNLYILAGMAFAFVFYFWLTQKGYAHKLVLLSSGSYFCFFTAPTVTDVPQKRTV